MAACYVAIDFDGTIVKHEYPKIGADIDAVFWLKQAVDLGAKLILHTMRSGEELEDAQAWLEEKGVELYALNSNPTQKHWTQSPKIYAHIYVDDAAIGIPLAAPAFDGERPFVNWILAGPMLIERITAVKAGAK